MKIKILLSILISIVFTLSNVNAEENQNLPEEEIITTESTAEDIADEIKVTNKYLLIYFSDFFTNTPESYKYINLNYNNIDEWSALEHALKVLVYHDKIDNLNVSIKNDNIPNAYTFYKAASKILDFEFTLKKDELVARNIKQMDLDYVTKIFNVRLSKEIHDNNSTIWNEYLWEKEEIFNDVYKTLTNSHYDKENISTDDLIYWAIEWLAEWTWDKHTVFFPPVESADFTESLNWEFQWIWAYVEMTSPWVVTITSPISGWPAEEAWIQGWDIIIKADDNIVTEQNSLEEVVSWIKWEEWSTVTLTISRKWKEKVIEVVRWTIVVKNIEHERLKTSTYYIKLKTFWAWISWEFKEALEEINRHPSIKKIIIDLRNNGGWFLSEVTEMLSYVVPEWEPTAVIKYQWFNKIYRSAGYDLIDLSKYEIVVLQNSWTASASEIMIWTMSDYLDITKIGEKSYWKGSVQTIKNYDDGSSFKYTIAKWFTWKTETGIDWIWINPDIELEYDIEKYKETGEDNQLNEAISQ